MENLAVALEPLVVGTADLHRNRLQVCLHQGVVQRSRSALVHQSNVHLGDDVQQRYRQEWAARAYSCLRFFRSGQGIRHFLVYFVGDSTRDRNGRVGIDVTEYLWHYICDVMRFLCHLLTSSSTRVLIWGPSPRLLSFRRSICQVGSAFLLPGVRLTLLFEPWLALLVPVYGRRLPQRCLRRHASSQLLRAPIRLMRLGRLP